MLEPYRVINGFPICTHSIDDEKVLSGIDTHIHISKMTGPAFGFTVIVPCLLSASENIRRVPPGQLSLSDSSPAAPQRTHPIYARWICKKSLI